RTTPLNPRTYNLYPLTLHHALQIFYREKKKLDDKFASLFKKAGRVPAMNKQIKLVREKHDELLAYKKNEATYRDKIEQKGKLERSEEHTSELQSRFDLVCSLLREKK